MAYAAIVMATIFYIATRCIMIIARRPLPSRCNVRTLWLVLNNDYMMSWLFVNSKVWSMGVNLEIQQNRALELKLQQTKFAICHALFNDFKLGTTMGQRLE